MNIAGVQSRTIPSRLGMLQLLLHFLSHCRDNENQSLMWVAAILVHIFRCAFRPSAPTDFGCNESCSAPVHCWKQSLMSPLMVASYHVVKFYLDIAKFYKWNCLQTMVQQDQLSSKSLLRANKVRTEQDRIGAKRRDEPMRAQCWSQKEKEKDSSSIKTARGSGGSSAGLETWVHLPTLAMASCATLEEIISLCFSLLSWKMGH